jgi:glycosyltransferase involved in cell wall biosynthesis
MKIGIYSGRESHTLGEAEYAAAILAEDLKRGHSVELVSHCSTMTVEELASFTGTDLDGVAMRYVPWNGRPFSRGRDLCRRYRRERNWQADLSVPYDLFINFARWIPPFCHAPVGVLIVLLPLYVPPNLCREPAGGPQPPSSRKYFRDWYYGWQWSHRLASYRVKLSVSHFSQSLTRRRWNITCPVLYPPVGTTLVAAEKSKTILSVARFTSSDSVCNKKQLELTWAYDGLHEARQSGWQLTCVGPVSEVPADRSYFELVGRLAGTCGVQTVANISRAELSRLYAKAAIFWHAAGLGSDPDKEPHAAENLGISTCEAMAAGCVPIVINRGALQEMVQHGVNGFLCDDLRELKDLTTHLVQNEPLRRHMSEAAQLRGSEFSRTRFLQGFRQHLRHLIPGLDAGGTVA